MVFTETSLVARKKGALARIWIAAHFERKLSKAQLIQTNIESSVDAIKGETEASPMALRRSGQLLLGVVRIYSKKTKYLLEDCNEALLRIKVSFKPGQVNLPDGQVVASFNSITMGESLTEFDMLLLPQPVLDLKTLIQAQNNVQGVNPLLSSSQVPSTPRASRSSMQRRDLMLPPESPSALAALLENTDDPFDDPLALIPLNRQGRPSGDFSMLRNDDASENGVMDVEVGRDAVPQSQLDFRRESLALSSVNGTPSKSNKENQDIDMELQGQENIAFEHQYPLSDGLQPLANENEPTHMDIEEPDLQSLILEHPDLPLSLSFEIPPSRVRTPTLSRNHSLFHPSSPVADLPAGSMKATAVRQKARSNAAKKAVKKRKELDLDFVIELDAANVMQQMRETGDITKKPKLIPLNPVFTRIETMSAQDYLGVKGYDHVPSRFSQLLKIREFPPVLLSHPTRGLFGLSNNKDEVVPTVQESQDLLEDVDRLEPLNFDEGVELNETMVDNEQSFDQDPFANALPFDDSFQENQDPQSPMRADLSFAEAFKDAEAPLLSTPRRQSLKPAIFPSPMPRSSVPPESLNGDAPDGSVFTREVMNPQSGAINTGHASTRIAISILQKELTRPGESTEFLKLAQSMSKKDTVKLFFETLVLKTRDLIDVEQDHNFGAIKLTTKPSLYATGTQ